MKRSSRTRLTAVVSGALMVVALGAATPAVAGTADGAGAAGVQVQEVGSAAPVLVEDLAAAPASVTATYYCAVRDGTFGCQSGAPGDGLVVAELFQHAEFGGWRVVVFNPAYSYGCSSGTGDNEGGANLGTYQNAVSAVKTYNHCDVRLFDGNAKSGAATGFIDRDNNLGSFNDRANSFAIS
ncbi:hypothetical protein ACFWEJ_07625 [Promicromonospora sp. NPDC060204]|uniref:hypothetical protein n=1 Tax=Promicromonospora sp. NPDC060204 TaxID=3347071 RepID=UPI0036461680